MLMVLQSELLNSPYLLDTDFKESKTDYFKKRKNTNSSKIGWMDGQIHVWLDKWVSD